MAWTSKMYGGKVSLAFDPKAHLYTVNGDPVPSVTGVTGVMDKPALIPWAVNMTIEHLERVWRPGVHYTAGQIRSILDDAKGARFRKSGIALNVGSEAHDWVEQYIKSRILNYPPPTKPIFPPVVAAVSAYLEWESQHDIEYISSEQRVCSIRHGYVGTCDIDAVVDGVRTVADLKTSKGIYPEYFVQAAAYAAALAEEHGTEYGQVMIIRIPKDGTSPEVRASSDIDELFSVFLACLKIWKWRHG